MNANEKSQKILDLLCQIDEINLEIDRIEGSSTEQDKLINNTLTYESDLQLKRQRKVSELRLLLKEYNLGLLSRPKKNNTRPGNKFFAMLDILGFSKIVKNQTSLSLKKIFDNSVIRWVQMALTSGEKAIINPDFSYSPNLNKSKVNNMVFSDTLMFWTNTEDPEEFLVLLEVIRDLYTFSLNHASLPLRGAITFGELDLQDPLFVLDNVTVNQSVLFGKAVVDAYILEKKQEWMGCIIDDSCINLFNKSAVSDEIRERLNDFIIEYEVPYKGSITVKTNVLNWPKNVADLELDKFKEKLNNVFTYHSGDDESKFDKSTKDKFENSIEFYKFVKYNDRIFE